MRLIATHSSRTLSSCFAAWRNVCDNASIARATAEAGFAAGCEQLRDSCFSGWARVAAQRKAARALLQRAVHKWQRGTAAEVIWAWSDVTRSMAARRAAAADKAHSAHRSLLATALQAWAVVAVPNSDCSKPRADVWIGAGGMDQERVIEAARRRSTTRLLRACLGVWREWSAGKREVREWTQLAAMKLFNRRVGAALQQWALIVLVRRQHDHAVRQQLARGNLRCISTHFLHWRNMVEESRCAWASLCVSCSLMCPHAAVSFTGCLVTVYSLQCALFSHPAACCHATMPHGHALFATAVVRC